MKIQTFFIYSLFALSILLAGCSSTPQPAPITSTPAVPTAVTVIQPTLVEATPIEVLPVASATPVQAQQVAPVPVDYRLNVLMDYDQKTLEVEENIIYVNTSGDEISDMLLAVEPNLIPGVFTLSALQMDGMDVSTYALEGQRLAWNFASPLGNGQSVKITVKFSLALPLVEQGDPNLIRPQIFGVTARQVNLTNWYPMVVPYQAENGWQLSDPWFYGEHLVYPSAVFDLSLQFVDPANVPVIAASAPAEVREAGVIHYSMADGRNFVLSMGRQFQVVSMDVDGVSVFSYFYPGNEPGGQAVLDATAQSIRLYSRLFGAYPHSSLSVVQGDFNDGMEFDGLYYLSNSFYNLYDNTPKNYLIMVAAHETCHQWWFGRVANDQAREPWLDESLSTYCEKLFYENYYADAVDWWWSTRVDFYQPTGKIDGDVAGYGGFDPYTNAVYRLGAHFVEDLRKALGDDVFFTFIKDYSTQMNGEIAASADFFRILEGYTAGTDLSSIFSTYFANPPR